MRERSDVPASELTTFQLGGLAKKVYEPSDIQSLKELIKNLDQYYILGNGSNVVFADKGISKPIIHLCGKFTEWKYVKSFAESIEEEFEEIAPKNEDINVLCFAGCSLMRLSSHFTNQSFSGFEFAAGIPGTIGGAIAMNAGAHGHEISEVVEVVYLINKSGELTRVNRKDIDFQYRSSNLRGIVLAAGIRLKFSDKDSITKLRKSCLEYRKNTQPLTMPSAGSAFVNIKERDGITIHAAELIENVGLKGERVGGVQFSPMHANWLVKVSEHASTSDLLTLVQKAKVLVKEKYSLELKTEIKFWDE